MNGQDRTVEGTVLGLFGDEVDVLFHGRPLTQSPGRRCCHSGESRFNVHVHLQPRQSKQSKTKQNKKKKIHIKIVHRRVELVVLIRTNTVCLHR